MDYYDKVLTAIASSLLGGAVLGVVTPLAFHGGVLFGGTIAALVLLDAIYRNPPLPVSNERTMAFIGVSLAVLLGMMWFLLLI